MLKTVKKSGAHIKRTTERKTFFPPVTIGLIGNPVLKVTPPEYNITYGIETSDTDSKTADDSRRGRNNKIKKEELLKGLKESDVSSHRRFSFYTSRRRRHVNSINTRIERCSIERKLMCGKETDWCIHFPIG